MSGDDGAVLSFAGRKYLVTGVLNDESIAWHVASALQRAGAEVVLTSFGRAARVTRKAADLLPSPLDVLELDVTDDACFDRLSAQLDERWGRLDGVLHSIAYAPPDALGRAFLSTPPASAMEGFRVSSYSLQQLAGALSSLLSRSEHGGAVVGMTVDASRALPGYDWMGIFKTALEAIAKYLAVYLGPSGIRVNLVAAGPVGTFSGRAVSSFDEIADYYERCAPLGWDRNDPARIVGAVLFLLSDLARYTTGQVLHADGGAHAVAGDIRAAPPAAAVNPATSFPSTPNSKGGQQPVVDRSEFRSRFDAFVADLGDGRSSAGVGDEENLFDAGVLDSFSVIKLIRFIEGMVGRPIDLDEASIDSFATVDLIYDKFVARPA